MFSFVFNFDKKWKTKYSSFFVFHFHKGIEDELLKQIKGNFDYFHKYGLYVTQKQIRVKSFEIFRCTMVTWTPRIRCLDNS